MTMLVREPAICRKCGNHPTDYNDHKNFEIPSEYVLNQYNIPTCFVDTRTKYKELYDRMSDEGLGNYTFSDKEDFYNVLRALLKMDEIERSNR